MARRGSAGAILTNGIGHTYPGRIWNDAHFGLYDLDWYMYGHKNGRRTLRHLDAHPRQPPPQWRATIELDLVFDASLLVMDMAARDGAIVLSNMEALHLTMFPERISDEPAR